MKYLVLGSSGMIGRGATAWLRNNGHEVLEFDLKNSPEQDLRIPNNAQLDSMLAQVDFVYFLACDIGGSKFLSTAQNNFDFVQNNLKIITNTFDMLEKHGVPFIFSSSQMSQMTHSNYGVIKLLGEKLTAALGGLTVKFWNVYGPEEVNDRSHVIADFIHAAKTNNRIEMLSNGQESRQMLHIDDCSRALFVLSQQYSTLPRNQEYHITNFEWTTIRKVADAVAGFFPDCKVILGQTQDTVQNDSKLEPNRYILNYWKPTMDLTQGIGTMI